MQENDKIMYQTTSLSPDVIDKLVVDDSPQILFDEFWAFLGVDIPIANIEEKDFKTIQLMVRREILNILERYPESKWDKINIVEHELVPKTDDQGNIITKTVDGKQEPVYIKRIKKQYSLVEMLNSMDSKVYIKLCRARNGFTLNALTMERSHVKQDLTENRPTAMQQPQQAQGQATVDKGWGL